MSLQVRSRGGSISSRDRWVVWLFLAFGLLSGALVTGAVPLPGPLSFAPLTLVTVLAFGLTVPYLIRHWSIALGLFLVWLVMEDLFRKLAGNDLRIYFAKDVIFFVVLIGLLLDPKIREWWTSATGAVRYLLYALVAWAVIMAVPSLWSDPRLPLIGLRLDFMYVPLVAAGFAVGSARSSMRRWLLFTAAVAALISCIGIIQSIIGPSFLSPGRETPGLIHLELFRGIGSTVYRPTATFVDPGRFDSYAVLGFAVSLAAFVVLRGGRRVLALACVLANGAGIWVSGGRTGLLVGVVLLAVAAISGPVAERRVAPGRAIGIVAGIVVGGALLTALLPGVIGARLQWYSETLDPRSPFNEWAFRANSVILNTRSGLEIGGLMGEGTGTESLGKQYLSGQPDVVAGRYSVEGGYAAVAVEWGLVGVALWSAWSISWVARQWRSIKAARGHMTAAAGFVLFAWMIFFLFIGFAGGLQAFQNYIANAYFWLLSGLMFALPLAANDLRRPSPSLVDAQA